MRDQKSHCTIYIKLSMAGQQKESSASMIDISACKFPGFGGHFNLYIMELSCIWNAYLQVVYG